MKDFITWKKDWNTGINKIDEQHQHFVGIINRTYILNKSSKDKEILEAILNDLTEYARVHFSTEEEYFDETDYPESNEHKDKHQELLEKVINFNKRFETKEDVSKLTDDFLKFLKDWLDKHLIKVDHKYVSWLIKHGIK
jgi:hemerythrin-like metal-binding protein